MAKKEKSDLDFLRDRLAELGFADDVAAKKLLKSLAENAVPDSAVGDVYNMISIAVHETKKRMKKKKVVDAMD